MRKMTEGPPNAIACERDHGEARLHQVRPMCRGLSQGCIKFLDDRKRESPEQRILISCSQGSQTCSIILMYAVILDRV